MSDVTRLIIDIPSAQLKPWSLDQVRGAAEQACAELGLTPTITAPTMLTFTQLMEVQSSEGYACDHVSLPDHPEFISGSETDGGYVTALLWVEGIERPVTMERLLVLREQGFLAGVGDKHLEGLLAYVHEQYAPDANISTADLEEIDEAYATAQEDNDA